MVALVVNQPGRDANSDDLLQTARNWEESGDWGRGIDTYLSVSEYHVKNLAEHKCCDCVSFEIIEVERCVIIFKTL